MSSQTQVSATTATTQNYPSRLGVPVRIGNVDIEWFNRLVLEGLYLEDQDGNVTVRGQPCGGGIRDPAVTVKRQDRLHDGPPVRFLRQLAYGNSRQISPLNLQFVIDAFASKDTDKEREANIDLRFNSIMIRRGNFRYNDVIAMQATTPGKFNAKHIDIQQPECQDISSRHSTRTASTPISRR